MAAVDERQGEVSLSLPQSLCERLAALAGSDESLEQAVIGLVQEADRRRRLSCSLGSQGGDPTTAAASQVGPEVHGGPEGVYERDGSTGRWRSVSRSAPVCRKETVQEPPPASEETPADLAAAREAIKKAQAETAKLWEAASALLPAEASAEALRNDWEQSHALAQAELEKKMRQKAWETIRGSVDMKTFTLITRRATGCEGERALSVGAARNIFEGPPPAEQRSSMTRQRSRPHLGKAAASWSSHAPEDSSKVREESPSARFRSFLRHSIKGGA
eukprot:TRINITY_DN81305_c0_g1_i1.p1 TRINITY_DN81305_c0_g1~~TRINITY_DN81305_c0_g1_i1.p1  ORF type:complete len:291 (+),score=57.43 TRINITY_DN81305_c0_g1_i1:50-874(+)